MITDEYLSENFIAQSYFLPITTSGENGFPVVGEGVVIFEKNEMVKIHFTQCMPGLKIEVIDSLNNEFDYVIDNSGELLLDFPIKKLSIQQQDSDNNNISDYYIGNVDIWYWNAEEETINLVTTGIQFLTCSGRDYAHIDIVHNDKGLYYMEERIITNNGEEQSQLYLSVPNTTQVDIIDIQPVRNYNYDENNDVITINNIKYSYHNFIGEIPIIEKDSTSNSHVTLGVNTMIYLKITLPSVEVNEL